MTSVGRGLSRLVATCGLIVWLPAPLAAAPAGSQPTVQEPSAAPEVRGPSWIDVERSRAQARPAEVEGQRVWEYDLTITEEELRLVDGTLYKVWAFGGTVPGPLIVAREGDRVRIRLTNATSTAHSLHSHGLHVPARMDGAPHAMGGGHAGDLHADQLPAWARPVAPGEVFVYDYLARPAGTHWYHCHVNTNEHLDRGMSGPLVVLPREPDPEVDHDVLLVLDEWDRQHAARGLPGHPLDLGRYDIFTLNGRSFPDTEPLRLALGEVARVRLVNAGALPHYMHLHGHSFLVTHRDGYPLRAPTLLDTVDVGPGQRVDLLIAANNPGSWPFHCHSAPHVTNAGTYPGGMHTLLVVGRDPFPSEGEGPTGPDLQEVLRPWLRHAREVP